MSFLTKIFSTGAGNLVETVGNTLDKLTTSKDEVMQHDYELKKAEMQYQLESAKTRCRTAKEHPGRHRTVPVNAMPK